MIARIRKSPLYVSTVGVFLLLSSACQVPAADLPAFTRQEDVIYGRKDGMALTMDVLTPKDKANGAAVVWVISGGFFSSCTLGHRFPGVPSARISYTQRLRRLAISLRNFRLSRVSGRTARNCFCSICREIQRRRSAWEGRR